MSSFLCFICHSTVNSDTNEGTRDKYREVVGMHLCPDSHLCYICCHVLNKLWLFKSICIKRSLEYPVLFSEKGTLNVRRNDIEVHTLCPEDTCEHHQNRTINYTSYHFSYHCNENQEYHAENNQYVKFDEENDYDYNKVQRKSVKEYQNNDLDSHMHEGLNDFDHSNDKNDLVDPNEKGSEDVSGNYLVENQVNETDLDEENHVNEIELEEVNHVNEYGFNDHENDFIETDELVNGNSSVLEQDDTKLLDANHFNENEYIDNDEKVKKKKKSKKSKKKGYEKFILNLEEQKAELEAARKKKKYLDAEFKCHNCALGFLFKDTYQTHMLRHEESNGQYRCDTCTLRFATSSVLRSHVALHATRHKCYQCGCFVRDRHRLQHSRRCYEPSEDVAACHLCGNMFQDSNGLQQHLRRFHKSKKSNRTYPCSVCGKSYNNQAEVRTHMIKHINRKFNCDQCPSTFSSPYTLNHHKKKHEAGETELFYCTTCNTSYKNRKSLLAHYRNTLKHQQSVLECPICNRIVPNRVALSRHMSRVHISRHAAQSRTTQPRAGQTRHATHSGAVCHLCGRGFKTKSKLNRHLREVCEKQKLEEELSSYYENQTL